MSGSMACREALLVGKRSLSGRFVRFSIAGTAGFATQIAVLALLVARTPLHYALATALATSAVVVLTGSMDRISDAWVQTMAVEVRQAAQALAAAYARV